METVKIDAQIKTAHGSKEATLLRRAGMVPCVIYTKDGTLHFSAPLNAFKDLIYTKGLHDAEINLEGNSYKAIVKELQFHPVSDQLLHIDFQQLTPNERVNVEIPVKITGRSTGVAMGGKLYSKMRRIKVSVLPKDLIDFFELDVTNLEIGKSIRIETLINNYPDFQFIQNPAMPVLAVEVTRAAKSAESEILDEEEGGEGSEEEGGEQKDTEKTEE